MGEVVYNILHYSVEKLPILKNSFSVQRVFSIED